MASETLTAELWRAAHAHPDDDERWAVLADVLLQQGDVRGSLIQLQRALARAKPGVIAMALRSDVQRLLTEHGAALTQGLPPGEYTFGGGTVEALRCAAATWLAQRAEIVARCHLRMLTLWSGDDGFERADFSGLERLAFDFQIFEPATVVALANNPSLRGLRALSFSASSYIDDGAAIALAASPHLAGLEELELALASRDLSARGVGALLTSNTLGGCRVTLRGGALDDAVVASLLGSGAFAAQTRCALGGWEISARGADLVLRSELASRLRFLGLPCHRVGDDGAAAVAECAALAGLERLDITGVIGEYDDRKIWVGDAGFAALCRAEHLGALRELSFGFGDRVTADGAAALAGAPWLSQLTALSLLCRSHPGTLAALLAEGRLASLERLRLNYVDDAVGALFLDAQIDKQLPRLRCLELWGPDGHVGQDMQARLAERFGTAVLLDRPYNRVVPTVSVRKLKAPSS